MECNEPIIMDGQPVFGLGQAAKLLNIGIGRNRLMKYLRIWGVLLNKYEPAQNMVDRGYMIYAFKIVRYNNVQHKIPVTYVTVNGIAFLQRYVPKKLKTLNNSANEQ